MQFDCVSIGDTIAQNIGAAMQCEVRGSGALTTSRIIDVAYGGGLYHKYCIISAGSYDPAGLPAEKFKSQLNEIRNQSVCKIYVWILPNSVTEDAVINEIANRNQDFTVSFTAGSDKITPVDNNALIGNIFKVTGN